MKPKHKWQAFDFRLRVIAESHDREHLFHMLSVLGLSLLDGYFPVELFSQR